MLRLILVLLFLIIFFILSIPVFLIEWIVGKINMNARHRSSRAIVAGAFRVVMFLSGVKLEVEGKENIPEGSCLFVGNHNSYFDIVTSYVAVGKVMGYVAKKEIKKVPFLNVWMEFINCLFLDRSNIKEGLKVILKAVDYIKSGISVCVFPEGTRSKDGKMLPFKEGSMKMAEKSNGIIVPMAITGTADILENHMPRIKAGKVKIRFGKVIDANQMSREEKKTLGAYTQSKIQEMLDDMQ